VLAEWALTHASNFIFKMEESKLKEDEYICPETTGTQGRPVIETIEGCESSCMGRGCRYKLTCVPYQAMKQKLKNEKTKEGQESLSNLKTSNEEW
jgi:hypothetical protein